MGIKGWFRRNNLLMAQAKDLQRQLQEAWDDKDFLAEEVQTLTERCYSTIAQLHRVARERDECYRQHRLAEIRRKTSLQQEKNDGQA